MFIHLQILKDNKMGNFFVSLFFIFIIFIFSGVFKNFVKKYANKYADENSGKDEDSSIFNDNTFVEEEIYEEQQPETNREVDRDSVELFKDYSLKKKNETFNKDSFANKNTTYYDNDRDKEIKQKKQYNKEEFAQEQKKEVLDTLSKKENITVSAKKGPVLEKIKKLSYLKQAVVLTEILGHPKGLDI